jgi:hypothetical protein
MVDLSQSLSKPKDVGDLVIAIRELLILRGLAKRFRASKPSPNGLVRTGDVRWAIPDPHRLLAAFTAPLADSRAKQLATLYYRAPEGKQPYHLLQELLPDELSAIARHLATLSQPL